MTAAIARRMVLTAGQVADLCASRGLTPPPGFAAIPSPCDVDGLGPNLAAVCAPAVSVLVSCTLGSEAAYGVAGDLGGSLIRFDSSDVEVSAWAATRLGAELARGVPPLPVGERPSVHAPLQEIAELPSLRAAVRGALRVTVIAPPTVLGILVWLATDTGWLALKPAEVRAGVRWATVSPVEPTDLGPAVAPFLAAALS